MEFVATTFRRYNKNCPRYLPFRTIGAKVLMWNSIELPFKLYDLMTSLCVPINITHFSMLQNSGLRFPFEDHFNDLIENENIFPLLPNMDFVDDIPPLGTYVMA